jgi:hypothetical protein
MGFSYFQNVSDNTEAEMEIKLIKYLKELMVFLDYLPEFEKRFVTLSR